MADVQYGYDARSQRFRDLSTGRYVTERAVRDYVDNVADAASRIMGDATAQYRAGAISVTEWRATMMQTVKDSHIASALAAYGGRSQMTPSRWGLVGYQIRTQYQYLRNFERDLLNGSQRLNGRADARARMYGQGARQLYENIRAREAGAAGLRWERNIRHSSESCAQCITQSALGWQPLGTLVPVGRRTCRSNCRCTIERRADMPMTEAA